MTPKRKKGFDLEKMNKEKQSLDRYAKPYTQKDIDDIDDILGTMYPGFKNSNKLKK
jgi:hypothetical protein